LGIGFEVSKTLSPLTLGGLIERAIFEFVAKMSILPQLKAATDFHRSDLVEAGERGIGRCGRRSGSEREGGDDGHRPRLSRRRRDGTRPQKRRR
jgi:hypothetical protein